MSSDVERIRRRRCAQQQAAAFFVATDDIIQVSKGTDAITQNACQGFVRAVNCMFLRDHNIDLRSRNLEDATFLVFSYLQSQTLNDYIEPKLAFAYGQALALTLIKLGLHAEKAATGNCFVLKKLTPLLQRQGQS